MLNLSCAGGHLDFTINTEYSWSTARWTLSNNQSINQINHCDRRITLPGGTDIIFGLFNLFTSFDMPFE
jgi:hypothetical protein